MADGTVHANQDSKWGFSVESTFGTVIADAGTFVTLDGPIPTGIDYGVLQDNSVRSGRGRIASSSDDYNTQYGGIRVIPFSDLIVRKTYAADLLYGVMQTVSEAVGTPYEKTFTWNHATTQPDFSANAGYFATIGIYDTIASNMRKFTSCILKDITFSVDFTQGGDGRIRASGNWISGFSSSQTANFSGTWAHAAATYLNFDAPSTKTLAGTDVIVYGFDITINNNAMRIGHDSSGNCQNLVIGQPEYEITGNLSLKYDADTDGSIADFVAGSVRQIQIATGTDGADGNLDFLVPYAKYTGVTKDYGSPEGQKINLAFKGLGISGDANGALVITLSDAVDRAW